MANQRLSRKVINICAVCIILIAIIFTAIMLILNYDEKGETNMPFEITKISIVSTVNGQDVEDGANKWHLNAIQNNDIYIYIEKNNEYSKQETISSVKIDNFNIKKFPQIGEIKIYKPITSETSLFKNSDENIISNLEFKGAKLTDTRNLIISNQGGVLAFRCANNNIGEYISNEDTQINYNELIKKMNISKDKIESDISFNITIALDSGKVFKAENIEVKIPNDNIVEEGTVGKEYTDLQDIVFKRIENS